MKIRKYGAAHGRATRLFPDPANLITYLQYAVDDVAELDEASATFLRIAISHLEASQSLLPVFEGVSKLS